MLLNFIHGGISKDHRGEIRFVNGFDMKLVKRFYIIKNANLDIVRGWRAHRMEQRWFYVLSGASSIDILKIDNWKEPSPNLPVETLKIEAASMKVLHLPVGYATAFQALEPESELLVFADFGIDIDGFRRHQHQSAGLKFR